MKSHARVVIVGGGIMGVGLLYHLAEEGWTDCILVKKGELTSGSTWHAAGQCPSFIANYNLAKMHQYSNTLYQKLEEMTSQPTGWHGCGGICLATKPEELDYFRLVEGISANIGFLGMTTSGAYGHAVGKSLAFAYVNPEFAAPNSTFEIEIPGNRCRTKVLAEPAYDPRNERLRA